MGLLQSQRPLNITRLDRASYNQASWAEGKSILAAALAVCVCASRWQPYRRRPSSKRGLLRTRSQHGMAAKHDVLPQGLWRAWVRRHFFSRLSEPALCCSLLQTGRHSCTPATESLVSAAALPQASHRAHQPRDGTLNAAPRTVVWCLAGREYSCRGCASKSRGRDGSGKVVCTRSYAVCCMHGRFCHPRSRSLT